MGLSPALVDIVFEAIGAIHAAGATVLLVEQNAAKALPLCDRAYLIHRGDIIASGSPAELDADPDLVARHLGLDPEIATPIIDRALTPNDGDA
jgi:branched-chain amino acid transport system ATP-binding protein